MLISLTIDCASDEELKDLSREIKILIHLGAHPNVVSILGACTRGKGNSLYVILEFCANGSLQKFLRDNVDRYSPEVNETNGYFCGEDITHFELLTMMVQIAKGMQFLHSNKVSLMDLSCVLNVPNQIFS